MSFREKSAWITLVSVLLTFGAYYGSLGIGLINPLSMRAFHFGVLSILALVGTIAAGVFAFLVHDSRLHRREAFTDGFYFAQNILVGR